MWPRLGPIPTYSVFYFSGIFCHFLITHHLAKRYRLRHRIWITVSICYMLGMTIGAKALYDLQHSQLDFHALLSIKHYMKGGLWGGLLAYFCLSVPLALLLSHHKHAALDLIAVSIPVPWIFAKLACLFNGCCYGRVCSMPWAINFPEGARGAPAGIPLHPTQIYEILIAITIMVFFIILKREKWRGTKLLWFLIFYGIARAATEFLRGDLNHYVYVGLFTVTQLICLITAVISILLLLLFHPYFSSRDKPAPETLSK